MKGQKKGSVISRQSSGRRFAPEGKNTAPPPKPERRIAGYGAMSTTGRATSATGPGSKDPTMKKNVSGYGKRGMSSPKKSVSGGTSMPGPGWNAGTTSPKSKKGPSGITDYGSKYAPKG